MNYKKINNITGWAVFLVAAIVYILTMEKHGSFWDCGEFAGTAKNMGIPHPPGAPLFIIIGRIFSLLGTAVGQGAGWGVALMSALSSAFTILFLFWTTTHFAKKIKQKNLTPNADGTYTLSSSALFDVMAAGVIGALAYTFSDSFWYSAVESEVYAMSSLCTAIVFWAALKWEDHPDNTLAGTVNGRNHADKWMILIFFMIGLSIGVHLLNILTIPPIILIYYFKRYNKTNLGMLKALFASVLILGFVQKAVGQWSIGYAFQFEKFFVNTFGLPVLSGFIFAFVLLGVGFYFLLRYCNKQQLGTLRLSTWCLIFTLIGMSPYISTMLRARMNPGIDMYNVDNPNALKGYLSREQYGDFPLLYGQTYEAKQVDVKKDGTTKYILHTNENGQKEYKDVGSSPEAVYASEDMMLFPRIWYSQEENRKQFYNNWLNPKGELLEVTYEADGGRYKQASQRVSEITDNTRAAQQKADEANEGMKKSNTTAQSTGAPIVMYQSRDHLTQKENMNWFFSYQINWMYWRYFMWNFAGKQNDIQGFSSVRDGNWVSGIGPIDNWRLGNQAAMPTAMKDNKANNKLYFLPLILGLIGFVHQILRKDRPKNAAFFNVLARLNEDGIINFLLFFMTGFAIVVYLNQYGLQPRERDYAYVGSFYAFAVWIGLGVLQVRNWLGKLAKGMVPSIAAAVVCFIAVPVLMCTQEWDDHDRSNKTAARDLAIDYLESCPQNAILFTIGDNDTYPLWYAQDVEGIRTDVRVVNTSLLGIDWYLDQLLYKVNQSDAFKMIWKNTDYEGPKMDVAYEPETIDNTRTLSLDSLIKSSVNLTVENNGATQSYFAGRNYYLDVDAAKASKICNLAPGDSMATRIVSAIAQGKSYITKGDFGILNIIAGNVNDRPICFSDDDGAELGALGIKPFLRKQGMVYQFIPSTNFKREETTITAQTILNKFAFGNAVTKGVYYDEENRRHLESMRQACASTAGALVAEGKLDQAKAILQKVHTQLPNYSLPYGSPSRYDANNATSILMMRIAYQAKEDAMAKEIYNALANDYKQQFTYYYTLSNPSGNPIDENVKAYTADMLELKRIDFGEVRPTTQAEADKIQAQQKALDDKIKKGNMTGMSFNDAIFMAKNYAEFLKVENENIIPAAQPLLNNPTKDTTPKRDGVLVAPKKDT